MEMVQIFNRGLTAAIERQPRVAPAKIKDATLDHVLDAHDQREWRIGYDSLALGSRKARNRKNAGAVVAND